MNKINKILILICITFIVTSGLYQIIHNSPKHVSTSTTNFTETKGLFSFNYPKELSLTSYNDIYNLKDKKGNLLFQIFEMSPDLTFDINQYQCLTQNETTICHTPTPDTVITDLKIPNKDHQPYEKITRAEGLSQILKLKYPNLDFNTYKDNCFNDISITHKYSGEICYAKEKGIIVGINNYFYPESTINLFATLKVLFEIYEVNVDKFNHKIPHELTEKMTEYHLAHNYLSYAYNHQIFHNPSLNIIWPNKPVYKIEFFNILNNFLAKTNLTYSTPSKTKKITSNIYINSPYDKINFTKIKDKEFNFKKAQKAHYEDDNENLKVYIQISDNIYQYITTLNNLSSNELNKVYLNHDPDKFKTKIQVVFNDNSTKTFQSTVDPNSFLSYKNPLTIEDPNVRPNSVNYQPTTNLPIYKIYLTADDLNDLMSDKKTTDQRYTAHLELYENQSTTQHAITIKNRGNASRGYVKNSFTIENFNFFPDGKDEIKLRSMISDDGLLTEHFIYETTRKLNFPTPENQLALVYINDTPLGLYQATEAIKDEFFTNRNIQVNNYYYAQNITSPYIANLALQDEKILKDHYEAKGDEDYQPLFDLINQLNQNSPNLINNLNTQNIFNYGALVYLLDLNDSLIHNYYIYLDEDTQKWNMFLWDADSAFNKNNDFTKQNLFNFMNQDSGHYNQILRYLSENLSPQEFTDHYNNFKTEWESKSNLLEFAKETTEENKQLLNYDNQLWNNVFLERKSPIQNSYEELQQKIKIIENLQIK